MADPLTLAAVGWGISTAGWIISPIITRLLNKAFSLISSDESKKLRHHLDTNILPRLALTLEAVEGSERRSLFEQLVRELKSAFYEVEDILDDVEYCRLEKQLTISSKKSKTASDDGAGSSNQVLDFGSCEEMVFCPGQDVMSNLVNLRHILANQSLPNIIRLTSLQTLRTFRVRKEPGYELRQLRDLNKLRGWLSISGLENVGSKEEALEANLVGKERITDLLLEWASDDGWDSDDDLQAEILEGLCPPMGLEKLYINGYRGSRYPDWMVDGNKNGPKHLQRLQLWRCSPLGAIPELFVHLCRLTLSDCSWDALPDNMEHLTSLKELSIIGCGNIQSLPTLPQSLEYFELDCCDDDFTRSCKTIGDPNWQKIKHVPNKDFNNNEVALPVRATAWKASDIQTHGGEIS